MTKLSVVISAFNEENNLESCLESVKWADEIIVVNNSSTDQTISIAQKYTSSIYDRPNHPMLNINKNYGFEKANSDWILNLDGDESVDEELKESIRDLLQKDMPEKKEGEPIFGYEIARKNYIFGKWIKHTGWYPDMQLRLFKKDHGRYPEKHVHEKIKIQGKIGKLNGHIIHNNYKTVGQFLKKLNLYTDNEVENMLQSSYQFKETDFFELPKEEFLRRYFAYSGFKDDFHGLALSTLMCFYHLVIFLKIWEKKGFPNLNLNFSDLERVMNKFKKESDYWLQKTGQKKFNWKQTLKKLLHN